MVSLLNKLHHVEFYIKGIKLSLIGAVLSFEQI